MPAGHHQILTSLLTNLYQINLQPSTTHRLQPRRRSLIGYQPCHLPCLVVGLSSRQQLFIVEAQSFNHRSHPTSGTRSAPPIPWSSRQSDKSRRVGILTYDSTAPKKQSSSTISPSRYSRKATAHDKSSSTVLLPAGDKEPSETRKKST